MRWIFSLLGDEVQREVPLNEAQRHAIAEWKKLPPPDTNQPHRLTRYVVADVEASGLDMEKDKLISIGAVAVVNGLIDFNDTFEVVLRQDEVSANSNILIHGIGGSAQRNGMDPAEALIAFLRFLGNSPLVAYHAFFEQAMIARAMDETLGIKFEPAWIDLDWVLPDIFREVIDEQVDLDVWLNFFSIENIQRHHAVSDAYAIAQLLQVAIARGAQRNALSPASFMQIEKSRRWMRNG
jgi:DNA polymerase-3 subunit epsilon